MAESIIRAHILPAFADRPIANLKTKEISDWLDRVATKPARLRTSKYRQDTFNIQIRLPSRATRSAPGKP